MDQERRDFVKGAGAAVATAMAAQVTPAAAQPKPSYEIYAAKYAGPFMSKLAFLLWNQGWDQDIERYYYIWVVKGPTETILVDTGVGVTMAADRKLTGYVNPVDVAARIGVKPTDVTKVIISHMHWDHVGGMEMFPKAYPKATFYVQKREYDFWTKHPVAKRKIFAGTADPLAYKIMQEMEGTPRLQLVNGDMNIGPGLDIAAADLIAHIAQMLQRLDDHIPHDDIGGYHGDEESHDRRRDVGPDRDGRRARHAPRRLHALDSPLHGMPGGLPE